MPSPATDDAQPTPSSIPGIRSSGNLYLITFLATLFLLLFISSFIVLKAFVARRRHHRSFDAAIAAGLIYAPRAPGGRRRYSQKPKLHTCYLLHGGGKWGDMMPVSALPVQAKRRFKTSPSSSKLDQQNQPQNTFRWLLGIHHHDPVTPSPTTPVAEKPATASILVDRLQVSVLIAMPSPTKPSKDSIFSYDKDSDDENQIPNVVFGVTRLPYKQPDHNP